MNKFGSSLQWGSELLKPNSCFSL
jgi:hypothetical protein